MTMTVAFGASLSTNSINRQLARYAGDLLALEVMTTEVKVLDLNDYPAPLYSIDLEKADGIPATAKAFRSELQAADNIIISFAEHNGAYTAGWKSLFDWMSRLEGKVFSGQRVLALSTSPGGRGGKTVLSIAAGALPFHGAELIGQMSVPKFYDVFDPEQGKLTDAALREDLLGQLRAFA
ncbi:MAG: NADPH-dependent FMN reductase [Pseudomonadota bacterium]